MKPNLSHYLVLHDPIVARLLWIVISAETGEPALWTPNVEVGRVPMRFRTETLARAAADKLNATTKS